MFLAALAVILLLASSLVFAISPRFAWYYVLSGHWGRNPLGAPSDAHILAVRFLGIVPLLIVRNLILT